jgi:hypothetical protein
MPDRCGDLDERADQRVGVGFVPGDHKAAGRHVSERNDGEPGRPRVAQRCQRCQTDCAAPQNGLHAFANRADHGPVAKCPAGHGAAPVGPPHRIGSLGEPEPSERRSITSNATRNVLAGSFTGTNTGRSSTRRGHRVRGTTVAGVAGRSGTAQAASPAPVRVAGPAHPMGLVVQFAGLVPSSRMWSLNRVATSMLGWAPNTWMSNARPPAWAPHSSCTGRPPMWNRFRTTR